MNLDQEHKVSPPRVAFHTLGCRSNFADTMELETAVVERGAVPCTFTGSADVYVLNTCTVTNTADKEALRIIRRIRSESPDARIVVTGCMAELNSADYAELDSVDAIIGPGRKAEVVEAIFSPLPAAGDRQPELRGRLPRSTRRSISLEAELSPHVVGPGQTMGELASRSRYHLRVQEGCENACTFCIIPQTRGLYSSRPQRLVLDDLNRLADLGYHEVVLSGTHLGGYGLDCGSSLLALLEQIERRRPVSRVRLSSIDPNDLSPAILELLAGSNVFCEHLHICVQAFCDRTLKRMNRKYRLAEVRELLEEIGEKMPGSCIGSDLIVGFPGETREEVDQAIEVFLDVSISYLHVFPYSERDGTAATRLPGAVAPSERKRRSARWRAIGRRKRDTFLQSLIDSKRPLEIVVEREKDGGMRGTSREYAPVRVARDGSEQQFAAGTLLTVQPRRYDNEEGILECELFDQVK